LDAFDTALAFTPRKKSENLSGTNIPLDKIIKSVQDEYNLSKLRSSSHGNAKKANFNVGKIFDLLPAYKRSLEKLKLVANSTNEKINSTITRDIQTDKAELKKVEGQLEKIKDQAKNHSLNLSKSVQLIDEIKMKHPIYNVYYTMHGSQLSEELKELDSNIKSFNDDINKQKGIEENYSEKLEQILNQKPHRYQNSYQRILELRDLVNKLSSSLSTYNGHLRDMKKKIKPTLEKKVSLENNSSISWNSTPYGEYCKAVSKYFAQKIQRFNYINREVKPKYINLVQDEVILEDGSIIKFDDISTGQGISLYLQTLIKTANSDSRKVIALFDEVATMDSTSMEPILEVLRKLNESGKLMLAIFVKMDDSFGFKNLE